MAPTSTSTSISTSTSTSTSAPSLRSLAITETNEYLEQQPFTGPCRYFNSSGGCRAGRSCPYLHEEGQDQLPDAPVIPIERKPGGRMTEASGSGREAGGDGMVQLRQQAVTEPVQARVVPKPIPQAQAQDPREFQLGQIRRRFRPKETVLPGKTILKFNLMPSDPDFPFEMTALECLLTVPETYPKSNPTLKVGNKEIPRGFTLNIEEGFDGLAQARSNATLLELVKSLDKNLETFLSAPKADTVKLVINKDTRHLSSTPTRAVEPIPTASTNKVTVASKKVETEPPKVVRVFTQEEKLDAAKRRESETRQLEARMGRLPLFKKSADSIAFTIPVEPRKRAELPILIQSVKKIHLFVPLLYPLQPCRIQLDGVDSEAAKPVVVGFEKTAEQNGMTLMGYVNYLAQNMHILAKTFLEPENQDLVHLVEQVALEETTPRSMGKQLEGLQDPDRSHIQYIARPAEWTTIDQEDAEYSDSDELYSYDTDDNSEEDEEGGVTVSQDEPSLGITEPTQEKGTAISFPFMELYGIELFEIVNLNITVKCERCKDIMEVKGLKTGLPQSESCKKCAAMFTIGFRREFVHQNAVRAGFLDLEGCFVTDLLPSTFIPTCSQCSTAYPPPGIVSVQGENTSNVCRECHQKFSFKIHSVKFLRITSGSRLPPTSGPRRKKEVLGITPGSELPRRGRCRHYTKSFRWFRFSCCQKVYPCDKCHDEKEGHPNEWANRMICGWCSREGNYRPEDCGVCHSVLIGKKGGGFWEGGKGTRDKVKMSRKDPHKYRRPGAAKIKT